MFLKLGISMYVLSVDVSLFILARIRHFDLVIKHDNGRL